MPNRRRTGDSGSTAVVRVTPRRLRALLVALPMVAGLACQMLSGVDELEVDFEQGSAKDGGAGTSSGASGMSGGVGRGGASGQGGEGGASGSAGFGSGGISGAGGTLGAGGVL